MARLTNAELTDLFGEYADAHRAEVAAKATKRDVGPRILAELKRRKRDVMELGGIRLTRKAPTLRDYGVDQLRATLKGKAARFLKVDTKALRQAVTAGEVTREQMAACLIAEGEGAPYLDVTDLRDT